MMPTVTWPVLLALFATLAACGGQGTAPKTPPPVPDGPAPLPATNDATLPKPPVPDPAPVPAPTPAPVPADDGFRLAFHLEDGETSKDSHRIVWSCRVAGFSVVYSGPHGECERGQCAHKETRFALSAAQREGVIAVLEERNLLRDHTSVRPVRGIGNWVKTTLQVTRSGKTTILRVEGMTNEWGRTEGKTVLDPDARAVLSAFDALRRHLAAIAKGHFPEYHAN